MKISEMDKVELANYMKASREILTYDNDSKAWKRAFELIKKAGFENLTPECGKCITKVQKWLLD